MREHLDERAIFAIERPHPRLWILYVLRSLLTGPLVVLLLPIHYLRYVSLRYRFDAEGVHMRWGVLFRREVNLTYARIQDLHVRSGVLQRWLGLADLQIQTASGSASAEMTIEGVPEVEALRDFLYARMRGHEHAPVAPGRALGSSAGSAGGLAGELRGLTEELSLTRVALEALAAREPPR